MDHASDFGSLRAYQRDFRPSSSIDSQSDGYKVGLTGVSLVILPALALMKVTDDDSIPVAHLNFDPAAITDAPWKTVEKFIAGEHPDRCREAGTFDWRGGTEKASERLVIRYIRLVPNAASLKEIEQKYGQSLGAAMASSPATRQRRCARRGQPQRLVSLRARADEIVERREKEE